MMLKIFENLLSSLRLPIPVSVCHVTVTKNVMFFSKLAECIIPSIS